MTALSNTALRAGALVGLTYLAALLTGCAVGPAYHTPAALNVGSYTHEPQPTGAPSAPGPGGGAQAFVTAASPAQGWWHALGSPALEQMVQQALDNSPTLSQARAKLQQAQQDYAAQSGATLWPQADLAANVTREKVDPAAFGVGSILGNRSVPPFTLYSAKVSVSYALDLFGANRRALEGLAAQVDYQRFELDAAQLSLVGNVLTTAVRYGSLRRQIALTEELLADQSMQLEITMRRYEHGGVARADVSSQRSQVAQTRASLAPLRTQLAQAEHQLAVYLGEPPEQFAPDSAGLDLNALILPAEISLSVPSALARQRPDIQASEALLHQASANVGVATANLYPQLTLSAATGPEGLKLSDLTNVWSFGAGLAQPLFHGGQLRARKRSAQAAYEAALATYRQTVLQGLQQVADTLQALEQDGVELQSRDQAQRDAEASERIAAARYAAGGISQLALLDTERQQLQTAVDRVKAQAQRFSDTIALYVALGARWR
jgi:NodT family efflux transporter outer membrane factor (OMF) lipoprotein